jgi:S1-C subfamily serine protease
MRYVFGCLVAASVGSVLTVWLFDAGPAERVAAQERGGASGPSFPNTPKSPPVVPPAPPAVQPGPPPSLRSPLYNADGLSPEEAINVMVYDKVNRGVVNITTKGARGDSFFLLEIPAEGSGSGIVIDTAGHILTNFHVIEDVREVAVTLFDGKSYDATFVGADPVNDLAILKIDAPRDVLFPVEFGDSNNLRVGMRVFAIGNPFGLERTMTIGIISSLNRSLQIRDNRTIKSIIQIDAAVNPGNSGGPLLNSHGKLIGINTAIATKTGQNSGVGFAIPVNLIARVVPQLVKFGRVIRPEIGILRVYETGQGLLVAQMTPGGPAERAGLRGPRMVRQRRGPFVVERIDRSFADLIVEVDGREVVTSDDFLGYIESKKAGDQIELTIVRDGRRMSVPVVLGGGEQPPAPPQP